MALSRDLLVVPFSLALALAALPSQAQQPADPPPQPSPQQPAQPQQQEPGRPAGQPAEGAQPGQPAAGPQTQPGQPAQPGNRTFLGYRWGNADELRYRIQTTEQNLVNQQGKTNETNLTAEYDLRLKVQPAAAGAAPDEEPANGNGKDSTIEMYFEQLHVQASPQGIDVDSTAPDAGKAGPLAPLPQVYAMVRNIPLRLVVTPGGRVKEVQGLEEFVGAAREAMPASPQRDQLLALMIPLTESDVADRFASIVLPLPAKHVEPGYSAPVTLPGPGGGELSGTITFLGTQGANDGALVVERKLSAQNLPPNTVPQGNQALVVSIQDIRTDTQLRISPDTNLPLGLEGKVETNQSMQPQGAQGQPTMVQTTRTIRTQLVGSPGAAGGTATGSPAPEGAPPAPR
ncbi:MAG: hypothetical protein KBD01_10110 [Acidobacteria bacterium]|nr:hypothetical protein [Acidobacteriota bacterium]